MVDHGLRGPVQRVFRYLLVEARRVEPGLRATCVTGSSREFPEARDYAHTRAARGVAVVTVAPKMHHADPARIAGVLAHEVAHAVLLARGDADHSEREADALAECLFGARIAYDADRVQTIEGGVRPRPRALG